MSALPASPIILPQAHAVADSSMPAARPRPLDGMAFYRRHTQALLHRYLQTSMEIGRVPCVLGNLGMRSRVTSYRVHTFEDRVIFVFDVEKCLKKLEPLLQRVVAHIALEDYSAFETASLTGESPRNVARIYAEALDRLTRLFLQYGLMPGNPEKLSRGEGQN